jgi:hypothetical protein
MAWKLFKNIWVRGRLKACVVEAKKYEDVIESSSVLMFGGLTDNDNDTGIPAGKVAYLLHDGYRMR